MAQAPTCIQCTDEQMVEDDAIHMFNKLVQSRITQQMRQEREQKLDVMSLVGRRGALPHLGQTLPPSETARSENLQPKSSFISRSPFLSASRKPPDIVPKTIVDLGPKTIKDKLEQGLPDTLMTFKQLPDQDKISKSTTIIVKIKTIPTREGLRENHPKNRPQKNEANSSTLQDKLKPQRSALKHKCETCLKKFSQLGHLRNHLRLHTGERPFVCTICEKGFAQSGHLASHINSHTNTKPYACRFCDQAFYQSAHLRNHERLHDGVRPYACSLCKRSFTQSGHLVNHARIHEGIKPYSCSKCGRCFTQSGHLAVHEKVHKE